MNALEPVVEAYLAYLEHARFPEPLPTTLEEAKAWSKKIEETPVDDSYDEGWVAVDELIHSSPEQAWAVILLSLGRCDERDLGTIGAGSLETFMKYRGVEFIGRVLSEIQTNSRLREAFGSVRLGPMFPRAEGRLINETLVASGLPKAETIDWWKDA
jgi:hypothetical protein